MTMPYRIMLRVAVVCSGALLLGCGAIPMKKYYLLNYIPSASTQRLNPAPYPFVMRLQEMDIEAAYARPQIVYRQSPFELQYDYYRVWAVKPTQMVTDLIYKHLQASGLVGSLVRRFDEGAVPQYELSGNIESIEEYDSDNAWFAHVALRLQLIRIKDGRVVYTRRFDHRKQVFQNKPDFVIREMSAIVEYIMNQAIHDIDVVFSRETSHLNESDSTVTAPSDTSAEIK